MRTFISEQVDCAVWLANRDLDKKVILSMVHKSVKTSTEALIQHHYVGRRGGRQKQGVGWLRTSELCKADKALRVFIRLFGEDAVMANKITINDFKRFCQSYEYCYPDDDVTPNRLFYLIQDIRVDSVIMHHACNKCGQHYLTHRDDAHLMTCSICRTLEGQVL